METAMPEISRQVEVYEMGQEEKMLSKTLERVAQMEERCQLVMPEVRRQISVYEKALKERTLIDPLTAHQIRYFAGSL
jgi:hypothetical protein